MLEKHYAKIRDDLVQLQQTSELMQRKIAIYEKLERDMNNDTSIETRP